MVSFLVYDLTFLVLFSIFVIWFLKTRKENLSREGIIFMYRTQVGVKLIRYIGDNFKKTLDSLKYVIIAVGLFLMGSMIWMLWKTVSIYIFNPQITQVIKAPPIAPLIPYFPRLFGMESFFPPFYFTYFIVALAIVAVVHEFTHGIFMRRFGVKIKSTGLVFLGPILGAFVEEEKKNFEKKPKLQQMTVLGAGVFANVVFALIFYGIYVLFFFSSFTPSGYIFNSYAAQEVNLSSITNIGEDLGPMTVILGGGIAEINLTEVEFNGREYLMNTQVKELVLSGVDVNNISTIVFDKSPAIMAQMNGAIIEANGIKIKNHEDLGLFLESVRPGDSINFVTDTGEEIQEYDLILGVHPENSSKPYIGIAHSVADPSTFIQKSLLKFMSFKDRSTYYVPSWDGELVYFILHLIWWVMIINFLVALFNMLPLGMLDGGRFFYLTLLSITGSENFAKSMFRFATYLILFIFLFLMLLWLVRII